MTAFEVAMSRKSSIKKPPHLFDLDSSSSYSSTALSSSSLSSSLSSSSLSSSASSSASPPSSTPSSWRVRSNYLQRIGIVRTTSPIIVIKNSSTLLSAPVRTTCDLRNVPWFNAPLRYEKDGDDSDGGDVHRRNRLISGGSQDKKRVNFRKDVTVVPIPMRSEYSDRIKTKLWTGRVELCEIVGKRLDLYIMQIRIIIYVIVRKKEPASSHHTSHVQLYSLLLIWFLTKQSETSRNSPPRITIGAPCALKNTCSYARTPKSWYIPFIWNWDDIHLVQEGELPGIYIVHYNRQYIEWPPSMTRVHRDSYLSISRTPLLVGHVLSSGVQSSM